MKTESIRLCIQQQYGKEDYEEARKELATLEAENARLTAMNESMLEDAVQNTFAFGLMLKTNKEQAADIEQLKEKVRYAYVQIEALEAK